MLSRISGRTKRLDILGIEIGTSAIKAVAVRPGSPPQLLGASSVPLPPGSFAEGAVTNPAELAAAIKALVSSMSSGKMRVVIGVPEQASISRLIDVPHMPRKDLMEALPWEAERHLPFPIDEVNLDFYLQDRPEDLPADSRMEVVVVAARKETIAQLKEVSVLAGLQPAVADIKTFAGVRAVFASRPELMTQTALIVEVGAGSTNVALMKSGRLLMTRMIRQGADDFTLALQGQFSLTFDEAEQLKANFHSALPQEWDGEAEWDAIPETEALPEVLSGTDPSRVLEVLKPLISDLSTELSRSVEYYRTNHLDLVLELVVLSGGGSRLVGLVENVSDKFGVPVVLADPWSAVQGQPPADLPDMTVPVGLALWGSDA